MNIQEFACTNCDFNASDIDVVMVTINSTGDYCKCPECGSLVDIDYDVVLPTTKLDATTSNTLRLMELELAQLQDSINKQRERIKQIKQGNPDYVVVYDCYDSSSSQIIGIGDTIDTVYGMSGTVTSFCRNEAGVAIEINFYDGEMHCSEKVDRLTI